jgi:uncharacterized repeat protein (TIGR03803 family)
VPLRTDGCSGHRGGSRCRPSCKWARAAKIKTLHFFCTQGYPCPDGNKPYAGLTLASNGKFYGTTTLGGKTDNGTVFQITSAGSFKTIHNFSGTADGSLPWATPIQAKDGDLYGSASIGGSDNDGTLYAFLAFTRYASKLPSEKWLA